VADARQKGQNIVYSSDRSKCHFNLCTAVNLHYKMYPDWILTHTHNESRDGKEHFYTCKQCKGRANFEKWISEGHCCRLAEMKQKKKK
jgi:hypothetical protein